MKLIKLSYEDVGAEWGFKDLSFFSDVSLLVGASGVGKTRILRAVRQLRNIANDTHSSSFWGIDFAAHFEDFELKKYLWSGAFEKQDLSILGEAESGFYTDFLLESDSPEKKKPRITRETLLRDGEVIFERTGESFKSCWQSLASTTFTI